MLHLNFGCYESWSRSFLFWKATRLTVSPKLPWQSIKALLWSVKLSGISCLTPDSMSSLDRLSIFPQALESHSAWLWLCVLDLNKDTLKVLNKAVIKITILLYRGDPHWSRVIYQQLLSHMCMSSTFTLNCIVHKFTHVYTEVMGRVTVSLAKGSAMKTLKIWAKLFCVWDSLK